MESRPSNLLLLDTASLYFRAFYGIPETIKAPSGQPVNAVRGLLDFISTLVSQYHPTHLACCWDNDWRPAWRVDLVPSYKAHRVSGTSPSERRDSEETPPMLEHQIPVIHEVLSAFGFSIIGVDDFEADDVIGTLSTSSTMAANIVTGDRDLFQLIDDSRSIKVLYTARGVRKHEVIDSAEVSRRYGISAKQYADFAVLRGDPSDGLPGVKGVGDKTSARLLQQFESLDGILEAATNKAPGISAALAARLLDARPYLASASRVVAVSRNVPIGDVDLSIPIRPRDPELLDDLTRHWGLGSSAERLLGVLASQ